MPLGFFTPEDTLTPETIERRRKVVEALTKDASSTAPIKHWTQGAARVLDGVVGSLEDQRLNGAEKSNQEYQRSKIAALLGVGGDTVAGGGPIALPSGAGAAPTPQGAGMAANNVAPAKEVYEGLIQRGLSPTVAAGFAGNFHGESGFNTSALGDQGTSFGLGQWRGDRLAALRSLAAQQGKNPSDLGVQLDHVVAELSGPEKRAMQMASGAKTPEEAAMLIAQHYERPAAWALAQSGPKRANFARGVFDQFGQPSSAPVQMASAGGAVPMPSPAPMPPRAMPGSAMAFTAAGAPVQTDAQGRALNPDGTPTGPGAAPPAPMPMSQQAAPVAQASPFGTLNPPQAIPDWQGMPAPQSALAPSPAQPPAQQAIAQAAPQIPPGRAAVAQAMQAAQPPVAAPAQAPQASPQAGLTGRAAIAAALISDPRVDATTKQLAMGIINQQLAPKNPLIVPEGAALYDPVSRQFTQPNGAKSTDQQRNYNFYAQQEAAAGRTPQSFNDYAMAMRKAGASSVNIDQKAEGAFETEAAKAQAKRYNEDIEGGAKANQMMANINNMREISQRVGSQGSSADFKSMIGPYAEALGMGDKIKGLPDIQAFNSIIQQLAPQMRAVGSGSTSDIEFKGFLSALPKLSSTPEARAAILDTMEAHQRYAMQRAEIAASVMNKEMTRSQGDKALRALPDPMTAFREFRKNNAPLFSGATATPAGANKTQSGVSWSVE